MVKEAVRILQGKEQQELRPEASPVQLHRDSQLPCQPVDGRSRGLRLGIRGSRSICWEVGSLTRGSGGRRVKD